MTSCQLIFFPSVKIVATCQRIILPLFKNALFPVFDPAAAGYFHPDDCNAFNVIVPDNLGQLFAVLSFVQLGAANQSHFVPDKPVVKISVSIGRTVGGNQELGLSVYHADCPFVAGFCAQTAAVAFSFINSNNFSNPVPFTAFSEYAFQVIIGFLS